MPRPAKGPRLYLHPRERVWLIRDGSVTKRTGCGEADSEGAEKRLGEYIANKFKPVTRERDLARITVAEALTAYGREVAPGKSSAETIGYEIANLVEWWATRTLADVHKSNCEAYTEYRRRQPVYARNGRLLRIGVGNWRIRGELGTLSAAIGHWNSAHGPLNAMPVVTLPPKPDSRQRWLTRSEAAMLLAASLGFYRTFWCDVRTRQMHFAWARYRDGINWHLARFILIGLYTGSRKAAILNLHWLPNTVGGWVDIERGVMHRRGYGEVETNKRRPPVRLGRRILRHLRCWKKIDDDARAEASQVAGEPVAVFMHPVTWMGRPVASVRTAWEAAVELAWLAPEFTNDAKVTPHVLRHTRATWLMQNKVDPWQAGGSLGMSQKTLDGYAHHHPDWQKEAAEV